MSANLPNPATPMQALFQFQGLTLMPLGLTLMPLGSFRPARHYLKAYPILDKGYPQALVGVANTPTP